MSPLKIEVYIPDRERWQKVGELTPEDQPGSLSQNLTDGRREVYLFTCEGNESVIYKSEAGIDIADKDTRLVGSTELEEVVRLRENEAYTLSLKSDISEVRKIVRFTHKEKL